MLCAFGHCTHFFSCHPERERGIHDIVCHGKSGCFTSLRFVQHDRFNLSRNEESVMDPNNSFIQGMLRCRIFCILLGALLLCFLQLVLTLGFFGFQAPLFFFAFLLQFAF